jgi:hypothetical protein
MNKSNSAALQVQLDLIENLLQPPLCAPNVETAVVLALGIARDGPVELAKLAGRFAEVADHLMSSGHAHDSGLVLIGMLRKMRFTLGERAGLGT